MNESESALPVALVRPDVAGAAESMRLFQQVKSQILSSDDIVEISRKKYIKRSGWRKISLAFNISTELKAVERVQDGDKIVARVQARATAPNGRVAEEVGVCDSSEFERGNLRGTLHNVETKAATRAINRAISDLVGGGEVSAEEVQGSEREQGGKSESVPSEGTVEEQLEALPWQAAASGKCDYVKNPSAELLAAVRNSKGGVKGGAHHFTASSTEATLFRFKRGTKQD